MPRLKKILLHELTLGLAAGLLWAVALVALGELLRGGFAYQGHADDKVSQVVQSKYASLIRTLGLQIVSAYCVVGLALGSLAAAAGWGLDALRSGNGYADDRPSAGWRFGRATLIVGLLWAAALAYGAARAPQLYAGLLYERGGLVRSAHLAIAKVGARGVGGIGVTLLLGITALVTQSLAVRTASRGSWQRRLPYALPVAVLALISAASWPVGGLGFRVKARPAAAATSPATTTAPTNLIIIAADSLRPDHISAYGATRPTPNIDLLAQRGVRFEQAFVSMPRTFPSWTTILTGTFPTTHGVMHMFPSWADRQLKVPALPVLLAKQGYQTGVVGDYAADIFSRIDLGFQEQRVPTFNMRQVIATRALEEQRFVLPFLDNRIGRALFPVLDEFANHADPDVVTSRALSMLDRFARAKRPFMMLAFYSTTHFPYAAPDPYYRRYTLPEYNGADKFAKRDYVEADKVSEQGRQQLNGLYDGAVQAVDDAVGHLVESLQRRGLADNTLIVIMADHGEDLFEPGVKGGHGDRLVGDFSSRIPLIIVDPRRTPIPPGGRSVPGLVRDVDVAPTLHARLGLSANPSFEGVDLKPLLDGQKTDLGLHSFQETGLWFLKEAAPPGRIDYPDVTGFVKIDEEHREELVVKDDLREVVITAKHRAIRTDRYKLIYMPTKDGTVRYELYDLKTDKGALKDVAAEQPEVVAELSQKLKEHLAKGKAVRLVRDLVLLKEGAP